MNHSIKGSSIKEVEKKWQNDLISGLFGGLVSVTICAPLDIARTRLNMMHSQYSVKKYQGFLDALITIRKEEGIRGYFKGYSATVVSIPLFHSLFFSIYNQIKPIMKKQLPSIPLPIHHICASTITGLICDGLTNPLWVVRTRLQVQHMHGDPDKYSTGVLSTMRKIVKEEGFKSLYKGLGASLIGLSHVAVYFPIYEFLKEKFHQNQKNSILAIQSHQALHVLQPILTQSYVPGQDLKEQKQLQDNRQNYGQVSGQSRLKIKDLINEICQKEGFFGLYRGLKVDLVRVLPANAITFVVYEYCINLLEKNQLKLKIESVT